MATKTRKTELPWLNLVFCAMVLWSHCSAHPITTLDRSSWQFALVYLLQRLSYVSVYGFFLLSGIKLTLPRAKQQTVPAYWIGRMKSIFLPYVLAVALYYLWFCCFLHYFPVSLKDFAGYLIRGDLSSHFYFVVALFQFVLLMPLFRWLAQRWSAPVLLPFVLGLTWLSAQYLPALLQIIWPQFSFQYTDRIFLTYSFYYLAGCYIGQRYEEFIALLQANWQLITALFILFSSSNLFLCWLNYTGRRSVPFLEQIHMLYLLSAILFCFWIASLIRRELPPLLAKIDGASYLIYLYHCLVISAFNYAAARMGITKVGPLFLLRILVVYSVTIIGCVLWQQLHRCFMKKIKK